MRDAAFGYFGAGEFSDVATFGNGDCVLIARFGDPRQAGSVKVLRWAGFTPQQAVTLLEVPAGPGTPAYCRIHLWKGAIWCAFQFDSTVYLVNVTTGAQQELVGENSSPFCFTGQFFAWQGRAADGWPISRMDLDTGEVVVTGQFGRGTGLSRLSPSGSVVLIDDDRASLAGISNPVRAGELVVGEGPNGGAVWMLGSARGVLWAGVESFVPRCDYGGGVVVSTAGGAGGIRAFSGTVAELLEHAGETPKQPPAIPPFKDPPNIDEPKEQKPMQFTARQQEIVQKLYEQHQDWANSQNDDDRRKLAKAIAEQFRFEFGEDWGWKSAHGNTENDAPGKDAIAHKRGPFTPGRQMLDIFDMFNGSTRKPNNPISSVPEEESNQYFIPVDPVDHLGAVVEPPAGGEPPKGEPPANTGELAAVVKALGEQFSAFGGRLSSVERVVDGHGGELTAGRARDAEMLRRIEAIEKGGGTGTGGGPSIPSDLAKQIAAELLKLFTKAAA